MRSALDNSAPGSRVGSRAQARLVAVLCLAVLVMTSACDGDEETETPGEVDTSQRATASPNQKESTKTVSSDTESDTESGVPGEAPEPVIVPSTDDPLVDLVVPDADNLGLGMPVREARPPLTRDCIRNHYAARYGERYLMLECVVSESPHETWIRLGFLESNHAPTLLAYHTLETRLPSDLAREFFRREVERAVAAHGVPNMRDEQDRKAWAGHTQDEERSTLEIVVDAPGGADGQSRVERTYRHGPHVADLLTKRTP